MFVFGLGGLNGIYLGTISTDLYLHDTMFVVGHFHDDGVGGLLGSLGALYFWFPKMYGRMMNERLGQIHFWFSTVGVTLVFGGQLLAGYAGQQRRLYDPFQYAYIENLQDLNRFTSYFAFILMVGQLAFVVNFFHALVVKPVGGWHPRVDALRLTTGAPQLRHHSVVYRGPHEYNHPDVLEKLGRDWIGQAEEFDVNAEQDDASVGEEAATATA